VSWDRVELEGWEIRLNDPLAFFSEKVFEALGGAAKANEGGHVDRDRRD
jgi:hypothetical protein